MGRTAPSILTERKALRESPFVQCFFHPAPTFGLTDFDNAGIGVCCTRRLYLCFYSLLRQQTQQHDATRSKNGQDMKSTLLLFFLFLHHICLGQILNGSFEDWAVNPNTDTQGSKWTLNDWLHCEPDGNQMEFLPLLGTYRDSVPQSGLFALTLSRWYNYAYDIAKFKNTCPSKPTSLHGYYKYSESILSIGITDTAQVSVFLTKFNTTTQTNDTIGSGILDLATAGNFTQFQCPIKYAQPNSFPDSITIVIRPTKFRFGVGGCPFTSRCSYLTVDDISLSSVSGATEPTNEKPYTVFPNPTTSGFTISGDILNERLTLFNAMGELIYDRVATSNKEFLDTGGLTSGLYFLRIKGKTEKLIMAQ